MPVVRPPITFVRDLELYRHGPAILQLLERPEPILPKTDEALILYLASTIADLFDTASSAAANRQRIIAALEFGVADLQHLLALLRDGAASEEDVAGGSGVLPS